MQNKTDKKTASRRRARRAGMLAMLISTLLTPAGTIVAGAAVTAALVGSVVVGTALDAPHELKPEHPAAMAPPAQVMTHPAGPDVIPIEHDGETLLVALAEPLPDAPESGFAPLPSRFASPVQAGSTPGAATPPAPPVAGHGLPPELPLGPRYPVPSPVAPAPGESDPDPLPPDLPHPGPREPETETKQRVTEDPPPGRDGPRLPPNVTPPTISPPTTVSTGSEPPVHREATRRAVPEPSIWGLVLLGGAALALARRRRTPVTRPL